MFLLGIGGISGSGKTTLSKILLQKLPGAQLVSFDNYYKHNDHLSFEERQLVNYDHPDSLDIEAIVSDLKLLLSGKTVAIPKYDFTKHLRSDQTLSISPSPILIIEGIFTTVIPEVRALMDLIIYVDVAIEVATIRRIRRDITERERETLQICDQLETTVFPGNRRFIEPSKKYADFVVRGDRSYDRVIKYILGMIETELTYT